MKQGLLFSLCIALIFAGCKKDEYTDNLISPEIPVHNETQRDIVAKLTGYQAIKDSTFIYNRYIEVNRAFAREYLSGILNYICDTVRLLDYDRNGIVGSNVWGTIESTSNSDSIIIIGAHFDGVAITPGANDNASGVAVVYEIAKKISQLNNRRYKLYVVFFDQEELGLIGAGAFAIMCQTDSLKIHSVHTFDQIGWDADGDRSIEMEVAAPKLIPVYEQAKENISFPGQIHQTSASSDHLAFRSRGYCSMGFTEEYRNGDTTPYYHHPDDTYETINFDFMESSTSLAVEAITLLMKD